MRTKRGSIDSLLKGIEQAKAENKYNIVLDLEMLHAQYTKISKRDYLALLRALKEKYSTQLDSDINDALRKRCLAGDIEAIRLYNERKKAAADGGSEVQIIDDIK